MNPAVCNDSSPQIDDCLAAAIREGLTSSPKRLPAWLFYDEIGSSLFEQITTLDEYYLTRTEHSILAAYATSIIEQAAKGLRLRIAELGAGSAEKTRTLLKAAVDQQGTVIYEPIDVSVSALQAASIRIHHEIPLVRVAPIVMDYTQGSVLKLERPSGNERRLVLYIGSSIGNFEPQEAMHLLRRVRAGLNLGDSLLLGIDLVKDARTLIAAYDDGAGVTAAFNKNILTRINRDAAANFDPDSFHHRAVWNPVESRMEMHLESREPQRVRLAALDLEVSFEQGETIHTESSYKYHPGQAQSLLAQAGFAPTACWTDTHSWFAVHLAQAV